MEISPSSSDRRALVMPHKGQGMPNTKSKGHLYILKTTRTESIARAAAAGISFKISFFEGLFITVRNNSFYKNAACRHGKLH